jgi:hypothetical protein
MSNLNTKVRNQDSVYAAISQWYESHTYGPTYRDISKISTLSLGTVYTVCQELRTEGSITFEDGAARTIRITKGK